MQGFPKYTFSAKQGDLGVSLVSRIVSDEFGWLFSKVPQERDFGIDAQVEYITADGHVTGQLIAMQIKCGESFLKEKNQWGYVYRGELKHFNYLSNYPIPVLICICDPEIERCYWVQFQLDQVEVTEKGWKITVPFVNDLQSSKDLLQERLTPIEDNLTELQEYWTLNNLIVQAPITFYMLDKNDVEMRNLDSPREFFDRLCSSKELAYRCEGKIEFSFSGYDDDPRELFEIEEVRTYITQLSQALPELFFFCRTEQPTHTIRLFALCQTSFDWPFGRSTHDLTKQIEIHTPLLGPFLERHFLGLNEMTEWLGMSRDENKRMSFAVFPCIGINLPDEILDM
jgi:hypothetical protein